MEYLTSAFFVANQAADPWYNNGWIIGIATGLASGALIAAITPLFLRRRRARDTAIRRDRAAEDVLGTLRPSVATGLLPSSSTVDAICRASAFKRGLDVKFATPAPILIDVLVGEVMLSPFLPPDARLKLADNLLSLEQELRIKDHTLPQAIEGRGNYRAATIAASIVGACIVGAASALSVITKNAVPLIAVGVLAVTAFFIALLGDRITRISIGSSTIRLMPTTEIELAGGPTAQVVEHTDNSTHVGGSEAP